MIKNLDKVFSGLNNAGEVHSCIETVVIILARIKNNTKYGKIFFILTELLRVLFLFNLIKARVKTIGIIAKVLVSLTIVAVSRVLAPACIPSQTVAATVTDEVSLIAVPAKMPKPLLDRPKYSPKLGKIKCRKYIE